MQLIYKSEAISWATGSKKPIPLDFLPMVGPRGGRLVMEKLVVGSHLYITTTGGGSMTASDQASFAARLRLYDMAGNRFYMTGDETRVQTFQDMGLQAPVEPAVVGNSATNADRTYYHTIAFRRLLARRGWDFACPVEDIYFGGGIEVQMPANADLIGTGVPTVGSSGGDYTAYAFCREEFDMEFKVRDVRETYQTPTNTNWYLPISNRLLRGATVFTAAAGGGTSVATVTDLTCEAFGLYTIPRAIIINEYLQAFPRDADDPAAQSTPLALPFIFPKDDEKFTEYSIHAGQLLIRATSTMTTPKILLETLSPRDPRMVAASALRNRIPKDARLVVKTAEGGRRDLAAWGELGKFLPCKVSKAA